ncbi:ABC transporter ATP-binding protein [Paenibacillus sp. P26]|nr:ABC transporter ATP-binding protein [Paenibacillus sp. P26]
MIPAIKIENVWKKYKIYQDKPITLKEKFLYRSKGVFQEKWVLQDVSITIPKGKMVGLIGRNGSGKSTLLKILTKILMPDKGYVEINGRVSSLLELGAGFHMDFTGRENIYMNASIFGLSRKEIDKKLEEIIEFSELSNYIDNPVRTYSSGMYMRLAFSIAIHVDPDVLLIDEILAVGDSAFQKKMH